VGTDQRAAAQAAHAFAFGAMLAAGEGALLLKAVTDDTDAAMRAGRRQLRPSTVPLDVVAIESKGF
jgi:hypothetical protein